MSIRDLRRNLERRSIYLADEFYSGLQGLARAQAFTVSGLTSIAQVEHVLETLTEHVVSGGLFADWRERVLRDGIRLPDHRLDLVYRNQMQISYHAGRARHILDHRDRFPYLLYDAIDDGRARPTHRKMDGHVAPVDSPIWRRWYPPNGHRCRCSVNPLTREQAEAYGLSDGLDVLPDDGWGYSLLDDQHAVTRGLFEQVMARLRPAFRAALAVFGL